jgi:predicted amino acid racemase
MDRIYPCMEIKLGKIINNAEKIVNQCKEKGINVFAVTKVYCAENPIVEASLKGGVYGIADSRLKNLKKLKDFKCPKLLLRIPMQSQAEQVVKYCDISLNSEVETIKKLSYEAENIDKIHKIILMVDLGDLREGIWENDVIDIVREILKLKNIEIIGLGTNLTCYGGVIPDNENLGRLVTISEKIENNFNIKLSIISGGNSSSLYKVLDGSITVGINMLRIGEAIVLGRETAYGNKIDGCYYDAFILKGEVIELKEKPSVPIGNIGMDAFGQKPTFEDKGNIKRAIVAVGRQDIKLDGLIPLDDNIDVLGASSDHLILDVTQCKKAYKVGDIIEFNVDYGCMLQAMTSPYIEKYYVE